MTRSSHSATRRRSAPAMQYKPKRKAAPATTAGGDGPGIDGLSLDPSWVMEQYGVAPYEASDDTSSTDSLSAIEAARRLSRDLSESERLFGSQVLTDVDDDPASVSSVSSVANAPCECEVGESPVLPSPVAASVEPKPGSARASILAMEVDASDTDRPSIRGMSGLSLEDFEEDDGDDGHKNGDARGEIPDGDKKGGGGDGVARGVGGSGATTDIGDGLAKNKKEGESVPDEEKKEEKEAINEGEDKEAGGGGGSGESRGGGEGRADRGGRQGLRRGQQDPPEGQETAGQGGRSSLIRFGTASNICTGSFLRSLEEGSRRQVQDRRGSQEIVAAMATYDLEDSSQSTVTGSSLEGGLSGASASSPGTFKYRSAPRQLKGTALPPPQAREQQQTPKERPQTKPKSALRQSKYSSDRSLKTLQSDDSPAPRPVVAQPGADAFKLSLVSRQYDLDGDGVLNEAERAMRDRHLAVAVRQSSENSGKLSLTSKMYDLDGDGVLNEVEQAMRNRDVNNNGRLSNREVQNIVQDQMKSREDYGLYKRVAMGLTCLVFILALSNFGTSWASSLLAKDVVADDDSGAIVSKRTREAVGVQDVAQLYDLVPLSDDEFQQRRLQVDAELAEDPDHPDHLHRRLGRKNNKNDKTIIYDHGKMRERDVREMADRCDRGNIVNARRIWREGELEALTSNVVCEPGTQVTRKGRKKKNKNKTKTKMVEDLFEFRNKGKDGKEKSITFECERGYCWGSGETFLQREGYPCSLSRDGLGASECNTGLVCYDPSFFGAGRGVGICTSLQAYARKGQLCDMDLRVNACVAGLSCRSTNTRNFGRDRPSGNEVRTGMCQIVPQRVERGEVCDVSFGEASCVEGYRCLGANGRSVGRRGIGLCTRSGSGASN